MIVLKAANSQKKVKVSKYRKQISKFSFEPKNEQKISSLVFLKLFSFGSNEDFEICFRYLLTFSFSQLLPSPF